MMRIAFFQNDLGVGGIQKSIVNLLRNLDYNRFQVDLYLTEKNDFWNVDFPSQLKVKYIKPIPRAYSFLPFDLAKSLIHYDFDGTSYDLAVDFNSYQCSCAVGALSVPAKRRAMWIHNEVEIKLRNEWKYRALWHFFKGKFKYFDAFVPVSEALKDPFQRMSGVTGKPFYPIQNYIDAREIHQRMLEEPEDLRIDANCVNFVALGRLCHQKGYDIMLDVFRKACERRDDLRLYIIGDGPDREALEKLREELSLQNKVFFLGNQSNPYSYMYRMDAFLSTSRYEGQPLNIMEAMAVGLPLYCSKNLEKYTEGLEGCVDLPEAICTAQKTEKHPDDLASYNGKILDRLASLAAGEVLN